jgi:hypothetical protein
MIARVRLAGQQIKDEFCSFLTVSRQNVFSFAAAALSLLFFVWIGIEAFGYSPFPQKPPFFGDRLLSASADLIRFAVNELIRFTWPAVALVGGLVLILYRPARTSIERLGNRTNKLKIGHVEWELTPKAAQELHKNTEDAFHAFRKQINSEATRLVLTHRIRLLLEQTVEDSGLKKNDGTQLARAKDFRCTLYIPDLMFEDMLYQLIDYYPWDGRASAGRTFSVRYGIIGRAWRLRQNMGEDNVQKNFAELMENWGMTCEEARRQSRQRPSYICSILRETNAGAAGKTASSGLPIALLFADSTEMSAFGNKSEAEQLAGRMVEIAFNNGLQQRLKVLCDELNKYSAGIRTQN